MRVSESFAHDVAAHGVNNENFTIRACQWLGIGLLGLLVAILAFVMIENESETAESMTVLTETIGITSNLLIAQNESLQFASSFERWLSGVTTGFNLKIRRTELAQPLEKLETSGGPSNLQVSSEYYTALSILDKYISAALPGSLSPNDQINLQAKSAGAFQSFVREARGFALPGSMGIDELTRQRIQDENRRRTEQYFAILGVLVLIAIINGLLAYSRLGDFRRIRNRMGDERRLLDETNVALRRTDDELQTRLDNERKERAEFQWLDSEIQSISLRIKSTVKPDEIAQIVVESLGQVLEADVVIGYGFAEKLLPRMIKQWFRRTDIMFDESIFDDELRLFELAERLLTDKRVVVMTDSRLIDDSPDPLAELVATIWPQPRSWAVFPAGNGSQVLGLVFVGMMDDARIWSSIEKELIKHVVVESSNIFIQARMYDQTMQIAENDAEVANLIALDGIKNDFIANMNHELRTPLTSIIGYVDMIISDVDFSIDSELAASFTVVHRNALRLQGLIENMMQLTKTEFQRVPLEIATLNIGHLLDDVVKSMELSAEESEVEMALRYDSPEDDLSIEGDLNQLDRVFINLLSNAIKFTPKGGKVTIVGSHKINDDFVEVKVADTGIGIPPEEFANMFTRFFRASTASDAAIPGFGIGLSLVQSIVNEHHGTITFDSTVGKGTVFTVRLPTRRKYDR